MLYRPINFQMLTIVISYIHYIHILLRCVYVNAYVGKVDAYVDIVDANEDNHQVYVDGIAVCVNDANDNVSNIEVYIGDNVMITKRLTLF